ncbi:hypothetical protein GGR55DRAFT_526539 [Xylaria sp. FL0064]|nr:hypothetical protein GGR55DRAFT_526539 [Xylaria sp. FL0064]
MPQLNHVWTGWLVGGSMSVVVSSSNSSTHHPRLTEPNRLDAYQPAFANGRGWPAILHWSILAHIHTGDPLRLDGQVR